MKKTTTQKLTDRTMRQWLSDRAVPAQWTATRVLRHWIGDIADAFGKSHPVVKVADIILTAQIARRRAERRCVAHV